MFFESVFSEQSNKISRKPRAQCFEHECRLKRAEERGQVLGWKYSSVDLNVLIN